MTQQLRKVIKGIIINDYFLSYKEFENFFNKALDKNPNNPLNNWRIQLFNDLNYLIVNYDRLIKKNPMLIYNIWENINIKYFNNTPVSILAATGLENSNNMTVYANTIESLVLSQNKQEMLQTNRDKFSSAARGDITKQVAQNIIQNHFDNMANTVINEKPNNNELFISMSSNQISYVDKNRIWIALHVSNNIRYYFYKQVFGQINYGLIWEAYIHHLAHWHGWYLTINQLNTIANTPVRIEEKPNFLTLLYNAKNTYSFTAGGDVIILDNNKKIITNVQVKGTKNKSKWIGHEISSHTVLNKYLIPWQKALQTGEIKDLQKLYDELVNTAWIDNNVDEAINKLDIDKLIKEIEQNYNKYNNSAKNVWWKNF